MVEPTAVPDRLVRVGEVRAELDTVDELVEAAEVGLEVGLPVVGHQPAAGSRGLGREVGVSHQAALAELERAELQQRRVRRGHGDAKPGSAGGEAFLDAGPVGQRVGQLVAPRTQGAAGFVDP